MHSTYFSIPAPMQIEAVNLALKNLPNLSKVSNSALMDIITRTFLSNWDGQVLTTAMVTAIKLVSGESPLCTTGNCVFTALHDQVRNQIVNDIASMMSEIMVYINNGATFINVQYGKVSFSQTQLKVC